MTLQEARNAPVPPGIAARIYVANYVALSKASDDPDQESLATQLAAVKAQQALTHRDGFETLGDFPDDGYSGSKRNRGPGLEAAIRAAVEAAESGAVVELWANTPARFARGTGKRNEARALGELFYEMQRKGVALRTVKDNQMVSDEMFVGIGSKMAAQYSSDLSESVTRAKRRDVERGAHPGGPARDGYEITREHDAAGRIIGRGFALVAERVTIWRGIFDLALEGVPPSMIARRTNAAGHRTRRGRPFDRRGIEAGITNPFYAGMVVYNLGKPGEIIAQGSHPAICTPVEFAEVARILAEQKGGRSPRTVGRPAQNHALANLAVCGNCGERMTAVTSAYVRKDGTRRRTYLCNGVHNSTGLCDAPSLSAELVDAAVIAELDRLLLDFDAWRERIDAGQHDERDRLRDELRRAEADHAEQVDRAEAVERRWTAYVSAGEDAKADLVLPMVERERAALTGAERRLTATRDALDSIPSETNGDALLAFADGLQAAVRGRLEAANGSMAAVNLALRELFDSFVLHEGEWAGVGEDGAPVFGGERRSIIVRPFLRASIARALADEVAHGLYVSTEAPDALPLRWLSGADVPEVEASSAPGAAASKASARKSSTEIPTASGRTA